MKRRGLRGRSVHLTLGKPRSMALKWPWQKSARYKEQMRLYRMLREFMTREQARLVLQSIARDLLK